MKQITNNIKAAFFDIDGTLVSFNTHQVPDSTRQAIEALRRQDIKIFVASGRHSKSINNMPGISFDGYVVVNGTLAFVVEPDGSHTVIHRHPIAQEDIRSWLRFLDTEKHSTVFVYESDLMLNYKDKPMEEVFALLDFPEPLHGDLNSLADEPIFQIITTFTTEEEARIMQALPHCKTSRWHPTFSDITDQKASKASGIQAIQDYFGWNRNEIIAFGDGGNDIEMLRHCGISVAMGNAEEGVKQHATFVTSSVDEDGVWNALVRLGLISPSEV